MVLQAGRNPTPAGVAGLRPGVEGGILAARKCVDSREALELPSSGFAMVFAAGLGSPAQRQPRMAAATSA